MSEEEKKAIEVVEFLIDRFENIEELKHDAKAMKTVLNLIEKQQKEIKEKNETIDSLERDNGEYILEKEKQDKMIDYMADYMASGKCYYGGKQEILNIFRKKVENEGKEEK